MARSFNSSNKRKHSTKMRYKKDRYGEYKPKQRLSKKASFVAPSPYFFGDMWIVNIKYNKVEKIILCGGWV